MSRTRSVFEKDFKAKVVFRSVKTDRNIGA
jgi:hypothetical protein